MNGLLIDDDVIYAQVLQRSLKRRGLAVQLAHDGATALRLASVRRPDFALVDLRIGSESGLNLVAPLRELRADMHIILVTGYANTATAIEAIKRGADHYFVKPVSAETLLRALRMEPVDGADGNVVLSSNDFLGSEPGSDAVFGSRKRSAQASAECPDDAGKSTQYRVQHYP